MRRVAVIAVALFMPAAAFAGTHSQTRIAHGFVHLGMTSKRAACYGRVITQNLDAREARKAASIVTSAGSSREVRRRVIQAGGRMVNAFTAAKKSCGS